MTERETPMQAVLAMLQYIVLGTEVTFLFVGPLSIHSTYRQDRVFDAACLVVVWVVVVAHLFTMWRAHCKPDR